MKILFYVVSAIFGLFAGAVFTAIDCFIVGKIAEHAYTLLFMPNINGLIPLSWKVFAGIWLMFGLLTFTFRTEFANLTVDSLYDKEKTNNDMLKLVIRFMGYFLIYFTIGMIA